MLVPDSQSCGYQFSSTSPLSPATVALSTAKTRALQLAVANAQTASDALLVANPWESWRGGFNLMKDIQRGNSQTGAVLTPADLPGSPGSGAQLPGLPPAGEGGSLWDRFKRNLAGPGGYRGGPGGGTQFVPDGTPFPIDVSTVPVGAVPPVLGWRRVRGGWAGPGGTGSGGRGPVGAHRFVPDGTPFPPDAGTITPANGWRRAPGGWVKPSGANGGGRGPGSSGTQLVPNGTPFPIDSSTGTPATGWQRVPGGWVGPAGGSGLRSGNARQDIPGWDSRFVTGPGGKFGTWPPGSNGALGSSTVATIKGWRRGRRGWVRDSMPGRGGSGRGAHARGGSSSWPYGNSIFGDGGSRPGNCGVIDCAAADAAACASEAVDVVPNDGILPAGAPAVNPAPPPNPALRTDQPDNIVMQPPFGYSAAILAPPQATAVTVQRAAGMGEWTNSLAHPGAIPADCSTMGGGKAPVSVPWWLWLLGGVVLVAAVSDEKKSRKASTATRKKAA